MADVSEHGCSLCQNRFDSNSECCCKIRPNELQIIEDSRHLRRANLQIGDRVCPLHFDKIRKGMLFGAGSGSYTCCSPFHVGSPNKDTLRRIPRNWKYLFSGRNSSKRSVQYICWTCYKITIDFVNANSDLESGENVFQDDIDEVDCSPFLHKYISPRKWFSSENLSEISPRSLHASRYPSMSSSTLSLARKKLPFSSTKFLFNNPKSEPSSEFLDLDKPLNYLNEQLQNLQIIHKDMNEFKNVENTQLNANDNNVVIPNQETNFKPVQKNLNNNKKICISVPASDTISVDEISLNKSQEINPVSITKSPCNEEIQCFKNDDISSSTVNEKTDNFQGNILVSTKNTEVLIEAFNENNTVTATNIDGKKSQNSSDQEIEICINKDEKLCKSKSNKRRESFMNFESKREKDLSNENLDINTDKEAVYDETQFYSDGNDSDEDWQLVSSSYNFPTEVITDLLTCNIKNDLELVDNNYLEKNHNHCKNLSNQTTPNPKTSSDNRFETSKIFEFSSSQEPHRKTSVSSATIDLSTVNKLPAISVRNCNKLPLAKDCRKTVAFKAACPKLNTKHDDKSISVEKKSNENTKGTNSSLSRPIFSGLEVNLCALRSSEYKHRRFMSIGDIEAESKSNNVRIKENALYLTSTVICGSQSERKEHTENIVTESSKKFKNKNQEPRFITKYIRYEYDDDATCVSKSGETNKPRTIKSVQNNQYRKPVYKINEERVISQDKVKFTNDVSNGCNNNSVKTIEKDENEVEECENITKKNHKGCLQMGKNTRKINLEDSWMITVRCWIFNKKYIVAFGVCFVGMAFYTLRYF